MPSTATIKELHAKTGDLVRQAGASRTPLVITDRGEPVAVLANPKVIGQTRQRVTSILPEFAAFLKRGAKTDVQDDMDHVRGDR